MSLEWCLCYARHRNQCRIILDSRASVNVFYNKNLIEDIWYIANSKEVTTGGYTKIFYDQVGKLASLLMHLLLPAEDYYYHENTVANLMSLRKICKEFRVVFDLGVHDAFYIFNDDDTYIVFDKARNNLYCLSMFDGDEQDYCFVTTVARVEMEYLGLDRRRVEAVKSLQKRIGFPNDNNLANAIDYNVIGNYQFNQQDIRITNKIHGKSVAELKVNQPKERQR